MEEAIQRGRKVGLLFIDLEAQYKLTIDHVQECFDLYRDHIEPYWVALPIHLRNAVSQYEPHWICWEQDKERVRQPPEMAITDQKHFPFFHHAMEFEEFVEAFPHWYGDGKLTACFVGIRSDESLNRWRTVTGNSANFQGRKWTTWKSRAAYSVYPIYDWKTEDLWTYFSKTEKPYNHLYDRMHQAGLTPHQMRICQPYGDDQRKGLWLFSVIEPETWTRIVGRVSGANYGAQQARSWGNALGVGKITCPAGHTWQSFAELLLASLPPATRQVMERNIEIRSSLSGLQWERVAKAILSNDFCGHSLGVKQSHVSRAYQGYTRTMRNRRRAWTF